MESYKSEEGATNSTHYDDSSEIYQIPLGQFHMCCTGH